jgi:CRP-like cAMP-binding protein
MTECLPVHPIFASLSETEMSGVLQRVLITRHARGEFLFHAGEPADYVFLLFEGLVKKTFINPGGDEKIISIHHPGDIFGELFLGRYKHRIGTARVLETAAVARLSRPQLLHLTATYPTIAYNMIAHLADDQRETLARLHALMHIDARHRLLGTLLSLTRRLPTIEGDWVKLPSSITQDDLAGIACMNRATVSQQINGLRTQGILGGSGRVILVNRAAVEQMLNAVGLEILE